MQRKIMVLSSLVLKSVARGNLESKLCNKLYPC